MTESITESGNNSLAAKAVEKQLTPSTSSKIADDLFIEICDRGPVVETHHCNEKCESHGGEINKYYLEAAKYTFRISAGDFSNRKTPRPIFKLEINDFSERLQNLLLDSKESLDRIVTEAAFRLFRDRHKIIFYGHIQSQAFKWELIT